MCVCGRGTTVLPAVSALEVPLSTLIVGIIYLMRALMTTTSEFPVIGWEQVRHNNVLSV